VLAVWQATKDGAPRKQTPEALGISLRTVHLRLAEARRRLAEVLVE
jgi:DNA-directed RNA polymerase specialized sigma24 family protein